TGVVALRVGGMGVGVSVSAFMSDKQPSIAIMKALGAGWRPLLIAYLLQTAALGLGGSLLGAALGRLIPPLAPPAARAGAAPAAAHRADPDVLDARGPARARDGRGRDAALRALAAAADP